MTGTMEIYDGAGNVTINNSKLFEGSFKGSTEVFEIDGVIVASGTTLASRPLIATQVLFNQFLISAEF